MLDMRDRITYEEVFQKEEKGTVYKSNRTYFRTYASDQNSTVGNGKRKGVQGRITLATHTAYNTSY